MFTIPEFCLEARISRALYYRLQANGEGPLRTRIGTKVLIARDTAAKWLKEQQEHPYSEKRGDTLYMSL